MGQGSTGHTCALLGHLASCECTKQLPSSSCHRPHALQIPPVVNPNQDHTGKEILGITVAPRIWGSVVGVGVTLVSAYYVSVTLTSLLQSLELPCQLPSFYPQGHRSSQGLNAILNHVDTQRKTHRWPMTAGDTWCQHPLKKM